MEDKKESQNSLVFNAMELLPLPCSIQDRIKQSLQDNALVSGWLASRCGHSALLLERHCLLFQFYQDMEIVINMKKLQLSQPKGLDTSECERPPSRREYIHRTFGSSDSWELQLSFSHYLSLQPSCGSSFLVTSLIWIGLPSTGGLGYVQSSGN